MSTPVEHRSGTHASSGLSRRRALSGLAVSGLGLALANRGVVARQPSPAAGGIPDLLQRWADSFSTSPEAVGALYTDDGVFEDVTTLAKSEPGGVAEFVGEFMAQVSDLRYDLTAGFRTDTWGMAEGTYSFRYTGQLPGLPPGTGEAVATLSRRSSSSSGTRSGAVPTTLTARASSSRSGSSPVGRRPPRPGPSGAPRRMRGHIRMGGHPARPSNRPYV